MTTCRDEINYVEGSKSAGLFFDNSLWSVDRLSQYLDVPANTIRDWCYKRLIPFVKVGNHVRFMPSDIEKWLLERKNNGH